MSAKGEQTRERILEGATEVFLRQGFNATSISALLEAAGTTKGNLYFHFADKDAVALAVLRRERDRFREFLQESLVGDDPVQALENFFAGAREKNRAKQFVGGCLFGNTALETADTRPEYAALVREVFSDWTERLREQIAAGQENGQIRTDVADKALAELIVETLEGAIMQARLQKSEAPLESALATLSTMFRRA